TAFASLAKQMLSGGGQPAVPLQRLFARRADPHPARPDQGRGSPTSPLQGEGFRGLRHHTRAPMNLISTEPIFHIHAELAEIRHFGRTPAGDRRVIDILGGRVNGPKLSGRILPGADWQIVRPDGTADLTARYGIETDAGARVLVRSDGLRHGPPDVL